MPVRHHDDHRPGLALRQQVVRDVLARPKDGPGGLVVARAVEQVEDRVASRRVLVVARRRVDIEPAPPAQRLRAVLVDAHGAVRHVLESWSRGGSPGTSRMLVPRRAHRLDGRVGRVEGREPVDGEAVAVEVGVERADGDRSRSRRSSCVIALVPPPHSPETSPPSRPGAASRNVTRRSGWNSGETRGGVKPGRPGARSLVRSSFSFPAASWACGIPGGDAEGDDDADPAEQASPSHDASSNGLDARNRLPRPSGLDPRIESMSRVPIAGTAPGCVNRVH